MRWLVRVLATLVVLLLLLGIMVVLMPKDRVLALAADRFEAATGRKLEIGSGAKVAIWPVLGVSAGPVRLANAAWGSEPDMLVADRIDIGLNPVGLLDGRLIITGIELANPRLLLERDKDGRGNWVIRPSASEGEATEAETPETSGFTLGALRIRDGNLRFIDHGSQDQIELSRIDLATAVPDFDGPVDLTLRALMRGQPLTLAARSGHLSALLAGRTQDLSLDLAAGTNRASFVGRAALSPLMAEGRIEAQLNDRPALAALIGQSLPDLPQGFGRDSLGLIAEATLTAKGSLHLREATVTADGRGFGAEADFTPGSPRPKLVARIAGESLTLPVSTAADGSSATPAKGWSTDKIDASALKMLDAEIALSAENVLAGPLVLGKTRAKLALEDGRAVLTLSEAALYGGQAKGMVVLNARSGLSASADITLAQVDLQSALAELAGTARLAGRGDLRLRLLGVGPSVDEMIRGLKGDFALDLGRGEIIGLDIAGMLRTMDPGYVGEGRKTIFDGLSLTAAISEGVARSEDLKISAAQFQAGGKGRIDLGKQSVDYRLLPRLAPKSDGSGGVEVPVLIKGPWRSPKVRLDLEWLASQRAKAEAARAEELAKQRLEALAQEKLGVTRQGEETLEDAAKRRAREAIEAETGRIFDRILQGN
ncbi:AsmA family protein [Gemmobacter serpentinus]|uniref:AsmA family protein n=1 Tax=Gemmobacter serpentinus TaxID=2652247 RepID=UPI0018656D20|nr:AsmA family protein [Gemmobacter serpentinus]